VRLHYKNTTHHFGLVEGVRVIVV